MKVIKHELCGGAENWKTTNTASYETFVFLLFVGVILPTVYHCMQMQFGGIIA